VPKTWWKIVNVAVHTIEYKRYKMTFKAPLSYEIVPAVARLVQRRNAAVIEDLLIKSMKKLKTATNW
jgi:hypothetical protein